jgi:hypothetical protein
VSKHKLGDVLLLKSHQSPKPHLPKTGLNIIKCKCGAEILLLPDLKAMSIATETHARIHGRKEKDAFKAEQEAEQVRDELIAQIFRKASRENESRAVFRF